MVPTELLLRFPCFKAGSQESLAAVAEITRRVELAPGQILFEQGETSDQLFMIVSGSIEVRQALGGAPQMVVDTAGPGDLVGWSALAHPHVRRSSCVAVEPCVLLGMEAGGLRELCAEFPDFGFELMSLVSQTISRRLAGAWSSVIPRAEGAGVARA